MYNIINNEASTALGTRGCLMTRLYKTIHLNSLSIIFTLPCSRQDRLASVLSSYNTFILHINFTQQPGVDSIFASRGFYMLNLLRSSSKLLQLNSTSTTCVRPRVLNRTNNPIRSFSYTSIMASELSLTSTVRLPTGYDMPTVGYGVYQTPADICESVVSHALNTGYRHVDSAQVYRNEKPCAEAIKSSGLDRSSIFFTSKISPRSMGYDKTKSSIEESLKTTGLDYIDLMLIHAPYGGTDARNGTWRALVEAQNAGQIRSIGVSNYGVHHLDELKEYIESSGVGGTIAVGQWELHPWLPHPDIVEWARANNVVIQAWSPLARATRADEKVLEEIGKQYGKTWAQVLIRYSLQKGYVPLVKSVTESRIESNTDVFDFELDEKDLKKLDFPESYAPSSWDPTVASLSD